MKAIRFALLVICYSFFYNSLSANERDEAEINVPLDSPKNSAVAQLRCSDPRNPNSVMFEFESHGTNKAESGEALFRFCIQEKSLICYDSLESIIFEGEIFNFASEHSNSNEEKIMTKAIASWWFQQAHNIMLDTISKNKDIVYTEEFSYLTMRMRKDRQNIQLPAESYTIKVTKDLMKGEYGYVFGRFNSGTSWKLKLLLFSVILFFIYFFTKGVQLTIKSQNRA